MGNGKGKRVFSVQRKLQTRSLKEGPHGAIEAQEEKNIRISPQVL